MISAHDKYAKDYDEQLEYCDCWLSEVIFGLCYEDIKRGETLLDIGIGTGLSSRLFHQAGLTILGIDGSKEMLSICRSKGIANKLVHQDLLTLRWPYQNSSIRHMISCGVLHFIGNLDPVFTEIHRIQEPGGLFLFTVLKSDEHQDIQPDFEQRIVDGIPVFNHSEKYIRDLLNDYHYEQRKEIVCLVGEQPFKVIYSKKHGHLAQNPEGMRFGTGSIRPIKRTGQS